MLQKLSEINVNYNFVKGLILFHLKYKTLAVIVINFKLIPIPWLKTSPISLYLAWLNLYVLSSCFLVLLENINLYRNFRIFRKLGFGGNEASGKRLREWIDVRNY